MGNHGKCDANPDLTIHVMASRRFTIDDVLGMCYDKNFGFSKDESSYVEGEEVHAYCGQRVIQPGQVAALF